MNSTHNDKFTNQVLALAGIVQAAKLVDRLAQTGYEDSEPFTTMLHALLTTDADSTEQVFIDRSHLKLGLTTLSEILNQQQSGQGEILRYTLSMIHLERKLSARKDMLAVIANRVKQAKSQAEHFSPSHENVIANLASLYVDTLSTFKFRIQINGQPIYLQQDISVNKIRTLLLAGIRSAVLWQQVGGGRLQVVFQRNKIAQRAKELLEPC